MEAISDQIEVTPALASHEAFIYATWLRNYKHASTFAKRIRNEIFFNRHHSIISRILARPHTTTLIAALKDDPDTILGYLVFESDSKVTVLHYCYVKVPFRNMGVATELFTASGIKPDGCHYTHRTFSLDWIEKKFTSLIYDPYLI